MKLVLITAAATLALSTAAMAEDAKPAAPAAVAASQQPNPAHRTFTVGQKVPERYLGYLYALASPGKYSLPPADAGQKWIRVETNAYLLDANSKVLGVYPLKD